MTNTPKYFVRNCWNLTLSGCNGEYWLHHAGKFVGRFKHGRAKSCALDFAKFLTANLSPGEYFARLPLSTPVGVLEKVGYVHYNVRIARERGWI